jgi:hypothetical protein
VIAVLLVVVGPVVVAAIWFSKTCRDKELRPKCINIRINGNNRQCNNTMKAAVQFRLNWEIKFLYIKKQKLNLLLSPSSGSKPESATAVVVAPNDGHEDAQNILSCI